MLNAISRRKSNNTKKKRCRRREKITALERRLFEDLLHQLTPHCAALKQLAATVGEADVLACFAERALTLNWTRPNFSPIPMLEIEGGRHPVVESQVEHFVANDLSLNAKRRLLTLTGPNMGGKSPIFGKRRSSLFWRTAVLLCRRKCDHRRDRPNFYANRRGR